MSYPSNIMEVVELHPASLPISGSIESYKIETHCKATLFETLVNVALNIVIWASVDSIMI